MFFFTKFILCFVAIVNSLLSSVDCLHDTNDVNDNSPYWVFPHEQDMVVQIQRTSPVGTLVAKLIATDQDIGRNAEIIYELISGDNGSFSLDNLSGDLYIAAPLRSDSYELLIRASDNGEPSRSTNLMRLVVKTIQEDAVDDSFET